MAPAPQLKRSKTKSSESTNKLGTSKEGAKSGANQPYVDIDVQSTSVENTSSNVSSNVIRTVKTEGTATEETSDGQGKHEEKEETTPTQTRSSRRRIESANTLNDLLNIGRFWKRSPYAHQPINEYHDDGINIPTVIFTFGLIGMILGFRNIYFFPMVALENGGWVFVFVYAFCVFAFGAPLFYFECIIGQVTQQGLSRAYHAFGKAYQGVGHAILILTVYNNVWDSRRVGVSLNAFYDSLVDQTTIVHCPPSAKTCNSYYDNLKCSEGNTSTPYGHTGRCIEDRVSTEVLTDASFNYFNGAFSRERGSWSETYAVISGYALILLLTLFGCRPAITFAALLTLFCLVSICVLGSRICLEGTNMGYLYLWDKTNVEAIWSISFWKHVTNNVILSLGLGSSGLTSLFSFRKRRSNIYWPVVVTCVLEVILSLGGLIVVLGVVQHIENNPQAHYLYHFMYKGGYVSAVLPQIFASFDEDLGGSAYWLAFYAATNAAISLSSQIGLMMIWLALVRDHYRKKSFLYQTMILCSIAGLTSAFFLLTTVQGFRTIYKYMLVSHLLDINVGISLFCAIAVVIHIYGENELLIDMEITFGHFEGFLQFLTPASPAIMHSWKVVCPVVLVLVQSFYILLEMNNLRSMVWWKAIIVITIGNLPAMTIFGCLFYHVYQQHRINAPLWVVFFPTKRHPAYKRILKFYVTEKQAELPLQHNFPKEHMEALIAIQKEFETSAAEKTPSMEKTQKGTGLSAPTDRDASVKNDTSKGSGKETVVWDKTMDTTIMDKKDKVPVFFLKNSKENARNASKEKENLRSMGSYESSYKPEKSVKTDASRGERSPAKDLARSLESGEVLMSQKTMGSSEYSKGRERRRQQILYGSKAFAVDEQVKQAKRSPKDKK